MINVDDRLLDKVTDSEMYLLLILASYFGETFKKSAFPSNKTLMERTKWGIDKLRSVKNSLIEKGMIEVEERYDKNRQTTNMYHVNLGDMLGYFVNISEDKRQSGGVGKSNHTRSRKTQHHPQSEKPTTIKHYTEGSIKKNKALGNVISLSDAYSIVANGGCVQKHQLTKDDYTRIFSVYGADEQGNIRDKTLT